jgi:hypothetical protein
VSVSVAYSPYGSLHMLPMFRGNHQGCAQISNEFEQQADRVFVELRRAQNAKRHAERRAYHAARREAAEQQRALMRQQNDDDDDGVFVCIVANHCCNLLLTRWIVF